MPRKEIDYSKTVLYKIVCNDLSITDLYVGSTTDFRKRKSAHHCRCIKESDINYNCKVYKMIRANGGWDNWTMLEIEKYPCTDGNEARTRERYHLELLNAKLNIRNPIRTKEDNKEYKKKFYILNKEKIKEESKKYKINNKEKKKSNKLYIENKN